MNLLEQEYTKYHTESKAWKNGLLYALVVTLVFVLFQSFGFKDKSTTLKLTLFPVYALLAYVYVIVAFFSVRRILKKQRNGP